MRKSRSLHDDDGEKTSLRPPSRTPRVEQVAAKDGTVPVKSESLDYSKASLETTRRYEEASAAARDMSEGQASNNLVAREPDPDYSQASSVSLKPFDEDHSIASSDATQQTQTRNKAAASDYSVAFSEATKQYEKAFTAFAAWPNPDYNVAVASLDATNQFENRAAASMYGAASSKSIKEDEKTSTAVQDIAEKDANNNLEGTLPPQILPGAVAVSGINSAPESDQLFDVEPRHSNVSDAERIVMAYAVDDHVHEASLVNVKRQHLHRCLWAAAVVIIIVAVVVLTVVLIGKDSGSSNKSEIRFTPIITNLCSPRHLKIYEDKLFVAEAGVGPQDLETSNLCLPAILSDNQAGLCFDRTGRVSVFHLDGSTAGEPPLTGLLSGHPPQGGNIYGTSAVDFDENGTMYTLVGLGYVNATELASRAPDLVFASILRGDKVVASPWVPLHENNYANVPVVETNPFHLFIHNRITYVVDAGADLLYTYLDIENAGMAEPDSVIVLPKIHNITALQPGREGPCSNEEPPNGPAYCGQYPDNHGNWLYSTGAVPTAVRVNPSHPDQLYVSYLAGTIWNEPKSGIFYMDLVGGIPQNDTLEKIEEDFWAIVDFGFYKGDIFVLETNPRADAALPFGHGRLSRVSFDSDGKSTVHVISQEDDLFKPVGMFIHEDTLFVTNNTFMDDCNGQILRAELS